MSHVGIRIRQYTQGEWDRVINRCVEKTGGRLFPRFIGAYRREREDAQEVEPLGHTDAELTAMSRQDLRDVQREAERHHGDQGNDPLLGPKCKGAQDLLGGLRQDRKDHDVAFVDHRLIIGCDPDLGKFGRKTGRFRRVAGRDQNAGGRTRRSAQPRNQGGGDVPGADKPDRHFFRRRPMRYR